MAAGDSKTASDRPEDERSDSRRDPLVGTVVNEKYRVVSAIARGGMGRIYYALQIPIERPVALKVVQGDGEQEHESQFLKRFLQEASILAKLQHPNVVTLFDYGEVEGAAVEQYFIAMEFLAGETLTHRLKVRERLSAGETLVLARQMVRGLREAHKRGIIHRDLKPSNIIIVPDDEGGEIVKLVDFGIGKVMDRPQFSQDLTQAGVFVGTPRYMAPEQFEGEASPASDLYALGTILFQSLAGRLPFLGSTMTDFMVAKLARPVPAIREVAPDVDVPQHLETLVYHLLKRQPEERPSMDALHQHLLICEEELFGAQGMHHTGGNPALSQSGPHGRLAPVPLPAPSRRSLSQPPPAPEPEPQGKSLRVGHTVVASLPIVTPRNAPSIPPVMPAAAPSSPSLAPARDTSAPPRLASQRPLILVIGLALVLGSAVGVYTTLARRPAPLLDEKPTTSATTSGRPTMTAPTAFTLTLESTPAGATVMEGETILGETPLRLTIERVSVATGPRTFNLRKPGYVASQITQGASDESVRSLVSLTPEPVVAKPRPPVLPPRPTASTPPPKTSAQGNEIRPTR